MPTSEYTWLREQISKLQETCTDTRVDVAEIKRGFAAVETRVGAIERTVYGNGVPGLKSDVQEQKAEIAAIKADLNKDKGWMHNITAFVGWVVVAILTGVMAFRR